MNIDYAAIIEKANKRKEALEALSVALEEAPQHLQNLLNARQWLTEIIETRLDDEGRALLPRQVQFALLRIGNIRDHVDMAVSTDGGSGSYGVASFVETEQ